MLYSYLKERMMENPECTICDETNRITFKQLIELAEEEGSKLSQDKYGILCKTELNSAKAMMACLYAQKTAVLLSERYGELHSEKIINTIGISYLLTDDGVRKISDEKPEVEDLQDVALILCTSGTTGNPKGAMITEENLKTNIKDICSYFLLQTNSNILIARPLYHCAVLTGEFFISLVKGVNIIFVNNSFNPAELIDVIWKKKIDVMCGTPTLFYHVCHFAKRQKEPLPLSIVACSGECMTDTVAKELRACLPETQIYNVYGLTEASPRISYLPPELYDKHPTSVGIFLDSVTGKIENGELLVKGKNVMKGYYNDPDHTLNTIQDDWLHTGDCTELIDGLLYIKGRKDNLIIRGGMNIYPQEIESAVKKDKRINEAYVFGAKDEKVGQRIHLQVESNGCSNKDIFDICVELLSSYQIPDCIEVVENITRNASGKLIRLKMTL